MTEITNENVDRRQFVRPAEAVPDDFEIRMGLETGLVSRAVGSDSASPAGREVAEGGGVEPRGFTLPWFSGPVANRLAAPSVAEEAGIEPAPVLPGLRVSNPVPYHSAILPVPKRGFEPPTTSASCWHVCQLRHLGLNWSRWVDSNHYE